MLAFALLLALNPAAPPSGWSATTLESAATPAQKQVLAEARPLSLTGEVVDVSCYTQLGKRGEAHRECGAKCVLAGAPVGLVTTDGTLYLVMPEPHHPRRDGQASIAREYAAKMGTTVTVSGMVSTHGGIHTLFVPVAPSGQ